MKHTNSKQASAAAVIREVFEQAVATKGAVLIRHRYQTDVVRFEPYCCGEQGASGTMLTNSGLWPRSACFAEIEEAHLVSETEALQRLVRLMKEGGEYIDAHARVVQDLHLTEVEAARLSELYDQQDTLTLIALGQS